MKRFQKPLALFLALVLALSCALPAFAAEDGEATGNVQVTRLDSAPEQARGGSGTGTSRPQQSPAYGAHEKVRAIVIMEDAPTVAYANAGISLFGLRGAPTESDLLASHEELRGEMSGQDIDYDLNFDYTTLLNGMSVTVEYGDLDAIAELPGVASVHVANTYVRIEDRAEGAQQMGYANGVTGAASLCSDTSRGEGMVIAVIDSGITPEHEVFRTDPTNPAIKGDAAIKQLGYGVRFSDKIPFYHDYYETRVNEKTAAEADVKAAYSYDAGGHGTHVAGIAAGYATATGADGSATVTFSGAAPQAQILAMKVFADDTSDGSTTTDVCVAALEDAYRLGADVINMSIGWYYGFTNYDYDLEAVVSGIYDTLERNGVIVCASAGNYYSVADWNGYLTSGWTYTDYVDYGTICAPATFPTTMAVAAAENSGYTMAQVTVNGTDIVCADGTTEDNSENGTFADLVAELDGSPIDYVVLGGSTYGYKADYEGLTVTDKVVLVKRGNDGKTDAGDGAGNFYFNTKIEIAADKGAKAVIIYNNGDDDISSLSADTYAIPAVFISKSDFEAYFTETTGSLTLKLEDAENPAAGRMVDMSCWGATPDLKIGVDIAAVGGHVRSSLGGTEDQYVVYSGTSMASPNMAGNMASLLQYLKQEYQGLTKSDLATMAMAMVESTAEVLTDANYYLYSPRKQGAGLVDIAAAAEASAYIESPICNLGDDPDKTGTFTISFTVRNLTNTAQTYAIDSVDVLYDYAWYNDDGTGKVGYTYLSSDYVGSWDDDGYWYPGYTTNAADTITVPANGEAEVTITVQLDDDWMDYFDYIYPNGNYIEGYVWLRNTVSKEWLHATYMGFYGDWAAAPVMEPYDWRNDYYYDNYTSTFSMANGDPRLNYAYLENITDFSDYVSGGDNYFFYWYNDPSWYYNADRFAFNPYGTAYNLNGLYMEPVNIRNARHMVMVVSDTATGEVYDVVSRDYLIKPYYYYSTDWWYTDGDAWFTYDGTDSSGNVLPNGTEITVSFYADIDYGEDVLGNVDWETADLSRYEKYIGWTFPCTIDTELPELAVDENNNYRVYYDPDEKTLTVKASDNQYLAHMSVYGYDENNGWTFIDYALFYGEEGETCEATLDVSGYSGVYLYLDDYATNESSYWIDLEDYTHEHAKHLTHVDAVAATCTTDGNIEYYVCSCDKYFENEAATIEITEEDIVIPATGHTWSEWTVTKEPTLTEDGEATHYCTVCDEPETQIILAYENHIHVLTPVGAKAAACTTAGSIAYWTCSICGKCFADEAGTAEIAEADTVIPATGHAWSEWVTTEDGATMTRTCTRGCGATETVPVPPTDADLTNLTAVAPKDASCEEAGNIAYWTYGTGDNTLYFADAEGETQIAEADTVIPAVGHTWGEWEVTNMPTLTETGIRTRACSCCDEKETAEIPVLKPHSHEMARVLAQEPSCTEPGNIAYWYCSDCGKLYSTAAAGQELTAADVVIPAHGHSVELKNYVAPTYTQPGYSGDWVCSICGDTVECGYRLEPIPYPYIPVAPTVPTKPDAPTEPDTPDAPVYSGSFVDVAAESWYSADVAFVAARGYMNGVDDAHFSPDTRLTRAMLAAILYRIAETPAVSYAGAFTDVADDQWYTPSVEWAALNGIVNGYDNGAFGPEDCVTREQLAAILYRYAQRMGYDVTARADLDAFSDGADVSAYAVDAMSWSVAEGLVNGSDGRLLPGGYATRAQIAAVIHRFLEKFDARI